MKIKYPLIYLLLIATNFLSLSAQEAYDNTWVLGSKQQYEFSEKFRLFTLKFDDYQLKIETIDSAKTWGIYMQCSTSFSDKEGNLLYSTNGLRVIDDKFNIIPNGDSINYGQIWNDHKKTGYSRSNGIMSIPFPGHEDSLGLLIHQRLVFDKNLGIFGDFFCDSFDLTSINIFNGNASNVIYKNKAFDSGHFDFFDITKHANGRDWWVVYPDRLTNTINRTLITKYGVIKKGKQVFPDEYFNTSGFHIFTPNGNKFITVDACHKIVVYEFDRCSGDLYNPKSLDIDTTTYGYISVSPNSRFLYLKSFAYVSQIDLEASQLHLDTLAKIDFFVGIDSFYNNLTFHYAQLARDKKIYIASGGSVHYMHVIHDPNKKGKDCRLEQHGITLPAYNYNCVNRFPNYRLGPIDGSPCDTLGLNNVPLAAFRYEKDSSNLNKVLFTDLTDYEPTDWYWTFGDGNNSTEQNPEHSYNKNGNYQICLYASNVNGGSTYCKNISAGTTQTLNPWDDYNIKTFPNPFNDFMVISLEEALNGEVELSLTDMMGKEVIHRKESLTNGFTTLFTPEIPNGLYILSLHHKELGIWRSKVLKQGDK